MSSSKERSMNYAFTLEVSGIDTERENYEDALYEAGCDDALIAVVNGTMFLDFRRDASSFEDTINSASRNVELAGGKVVAATPLSITVAAAQPAVAWREETVQTSC